SLAFDTIYAEGQRRYVESLSSYARQFLGQLPKPDVDYIGGLSPSVSIQQKTAGRNPRSTVGTITEVSDFLRVLYARLGQGHCPNCDRPITAQTREQIIGRILALPEGSRFLVLAPVVRGQKGEFKDFFADMVKRGYVRARVDGKLVKLTDDLKLDKRIKHNIEIVIDRLKSEAKQRTRIAEAVEQALGLAAGNLVLSMEEDLSGGRQSTVSDDADTAGSRPPLTEDILLSAHYACTHCNISYEPPTPQLFSFNSPHGMCPTCDGLGSQYTFDPDLLIPDKNLSFFDGAIPLVGPMKGMGRWRKHIFEGVEKSLGIDLKKPWKKLTEAHRKLILEGSGDAHIVWEWKQRGGKVWKHGGKWEGIVPQLLSQFKKTAAGPRRVQLEKYMRVVRCPACNSQRLNPQARAVRVGGRTLIELGHTSIGDLVPWFDDYEKTLNPTQKVIAGELLKEIRGRLGFLLNVGLHYLTLDRPAPTLSGGEAQRIRLAGQIGSGLVGVLYVLDEPSIGLHPRDNARLLASLERLRDMGNTVLVVEHDEETMRSADFLVDFGPGPGTRGGHVVASGLPEQVLATQESLTAQYLSGAKEIAVPEKRREGHGKKLRVVGATHNNLKDVTVDIPLGKFVCVTGVSGSGKSSLINDILREGLSAKLLANGYSRGDELGEEEEEVPHTVGEHKLIEGAENIDKVIDIDQAPIGRTPRSNPATYIKLWDEIRSLYAMMPDAKVRGYLPGRFSFNKPGGRCEACEGNGSNRLEMDFLADVWVTCPVCEGRRFNRETLQVRYRGKSIHDVLEMEVAEALEHFEHVPKVRAMLQTLHDVGLDYIKLGQPSPTLSGGEAQRIKLAKELVRRGTGKTLYILDEPTTGLHFEDTRKLLEVLHGFVAQRNTVIVIEHSLDVVKTADWVIDLGPDGGAGGGRLVATGTPEQVAKNAESYTGQALLPVLGMRKVLKARGPKQPVRPIAHNPEPTRFITHLCVEGACQHNLKNVSARLPREEMSVFCGPSGSGKSSLALDTIYAEGQRRYVESLSSYARQFLGQVQKPKVEHITGLSPAISIEQKTTSKSPRSTVGTVTEIYDYLRILYARLGERHCPNCGRPVGTQTADEIVDKVLSLPEGTRVYILAPVERTGQEKYETLWEEMRRAGFMRMRVDRKSYTLDEPPAIDHRRKHAVEVVVDRNVVKSGTRTRIAEAVEQALDFGRGVMHIAHVDSEKDEPQWRVEKFSQHLSCEHCNISFEALNPHNYSFNSPLGWCPTCEGLGFQRGANANLLIGDTRLSIRKGAVLAWPPLDRGSAWLPFAEAIANHAGFDLDTPFEELTPEHQRVITHGTGDAWIELKNGLASTGRVSAPSARSRVAVRPARFQYKGLFPAIDEASRVSWVYRHRLDHLVDEVPCAACRGTRIRPDAAATRFAGLTLGQFCGLSLGEALALFEKLDLTATRRKVAGEVIREITNRLKFLVDVGLDYLTLARSGPTLSGGEAQRIRLASQIGSGLTGVLYVLDEPTIGLHPADNERLLQALQRLRDLGNTLVLVEHDREVIASADYLLDFGPGAGERGGEITASGPPSKVIKDAKSLTGKYLSGKLAIPVPTNRRLGGNLTPQPPSLPGKGA
ncbi:MAG TPA: excinuclease ABC subunit UvrA, partial [Gemmata sp.]|nr:excinuclease ABC subunit UvrA [Gemmata sp.]